MHRSFLVFSVVLLAVLVCFYWPYLSGCANFYISDISTVQQPLLSYIGDRLRQGQFPLWNPHVVLGFPQTILPSPSYLLVWLFGAFKFSVALALVFVIQQWVCGVGTYLLVESFGWEAASAILAGAGLALCGLLFGLQINFMIQGSFAWFPACLWAVRRIAIPKTSTRQLIQLFVAVAFLCSLIITPGAPEIFVSALMLLLCYVLLDWWLRRDLRALLVRAAAILTGVAMSAPFLLPAAEWALVSTRSQGLDVHEVLRWSGSFYDLLCVVFSQPLGDFFAHNRLIYFVAPWYDYAPGTFAPWFSSAYLGPVIVSLCVYALTDRTWRWRWLMVATLAFFLVAVLGSHTPIIPAFVRAVHLTAFRYPAKLFVWLIFFMMLLAARGLHMIITKKTHASWLAWAPWFVVLVGAVGALIFCHLSDPLAQDALTKIGQAAIAGSVIGIATCVIMILRLAGKLGANTASVTLIAMSLLMLLDHSYHFDRHEAPADFYDRQSFVIAKSREIARQSLGDENVRVLVNTAGLVTPARLSAAPLSDGYGYLRDIVAYESDFYRGLPGQTADNNYCYTVAIDQFNEMNDQPLATLCAMSHTGVYETAIVGRQPGGVGIIPPPDSRYFKPVWTDTYRNACLYVVPQVMPRAYMAPHVVWAKPHGAVLDAITHPQVSGFDPRQVTMLEHNSAEEIGPKLDITADQINSSSARVLVDKPESVVVDVHTAAANFLVLADQYYPGWQACVDGRPSTIYRANGILRAIFVPAGDHSVEFAYRPASFFIGLILSICCAVILALLLSYSIWLSWRQSRSP